MYAFCQVCGRTLTDPKSRLIGYGPDCAQSFGDQAVVIGAARGAIFSGKVVADPTLPATSRLIVLNRILLRLEAAAALTGPREYVPSHTVESLRKIRGDVETVARILINLGKIPAPQAALPATTHENRAFL